MADQGWRLARTEKLLYEFEECEPGKYRYCVDFVGEKSWSNSKDYRDFLQEMGYRVFYKNLNLDWNVGKVTVRPWAEKGGYIATSPGAYNRELLIVEKENDGRPFELHITYEEKILSMRYLRSRWLSAALIFGVVGAVTIHPGLIMAALALLIPAIPYQMELIRLRREAETKEW